MTPDELKALQEKRGKLAAEIKRQANEYNGRRDKRKDAPEQELWPDETRTHWDKVNADYDAVETQLREATEATEIERRVGSLDDGSGNRGQFDPTADLGRGDRRRNDPQTNIAEQRALALQGWARTAAGMDLSKEHRDAMKQVGYRGKNIEINLSGTEQLRARQEIFATHHPTHTKRALTTQTGNSGGFTVPTGFVNQLEIAMLQFNGVEQVASIFSTTEGNPMPFPTANDTGNEGEIVGENADVSTEANPTFGQILFGADKYSSKLVKVPFELLTDSAFNFALLLGAMLGERIGRKANGEFTTGTNGIVTQATVGKTAALETALTPEELIDLQESVDSAYRSGNSVCFMMHSLIISAIRKLKVDGNFIWQSGLQAGVPDTLLGDRLVRNSKMASTMEADAKVALYGDCSKYGIRRVGSVRLMRASELYLENDQVGFIAFLRQCGRLIDAGTHPVKVLKMAAAE
ncbi:Phage capsid family protein [Rosistilla carotiformis]|uniref:Phage capsid family protein n=1 Tax=Rosistilla carotiformis TaxID=2528017 RepID=A0A518JNR6_9BACT|nr:phage major capsid protein [Rosistilla carotiformis]QDV67186.1 Phage capsid family protein [Rosistilla carotiformis]